MLLRAGQRPSFHGLCPVSRGLGLALASLPPDDLRTLGGAPRSGWGRRGRRLRHSRERVCRIAVADDADNEPVADLEYPRGPHLGGNVGDSRAASHSRDERELVAPVTEGFDLIVGELLPFGEEAPQPGTYSGMAIPDLPLDPRLGGAPLDLGVEQREEIIEPVGTVGVERTAGTAPDWRRSCAPKTARSCDRTPIPARGYSQRRPLTPANPRSGYRFHAKRERATQEDSEPSLCPPVVSHTGRLPCKLKVSTRTAPCAPPP